MMLILPVLGEMSTWGSKSNIPKSTCFKEWVETQILMRIDFFRCSFPLVVSHLSNFIQGNAFGLLLVGISVLKFYAGNAGMS